MADLVVESPPASIYAAVDSSMGLLPWGGLVCFTRSRGLRGHGDGLADLGRTDHAHAACPGAAGVSWWRMVGPLLTG